MTNQSELKYLQDLIDDFPCEDKLDPQSAYKKIHSRYTQFEKKYKNEPEMLTGSDVAFKFLFHRFALLTHEFLFKDIFSNAGKYRDTSDPEHGLVYFGPYDQRKSYGLEFKGVPPENIENQLIEDFSYLAREDNEPIKSALRFYQKFVYVHPFYDANGRIARLIVSIYLDHHGYFVDWKSLEKKSNKNKFVRKLNKCHKREVNKEKGNYYKYFEYLFNYFKNFVHSKEDVPNKLTSDEE